MNLFRVRLFGKTIIDGILSYSDSNVLAENKEDAFVKGFNFITEKFPEIMWEQDTAFVEITE